MFLTEMRFGAAMYVVYLPIQRKLLGPFLLQVQVVLLCSMPLTEISDFARCN